MFGQLTVGMMVFIKIVSVKFKHVDLLLFILIRPYDCFSWHGFIHEDIGFVTL